MDDRGEKKKPKPTPYRDKYIADFSLDIVAQ